MSRNCKSFRIVLKHKKKKIKKAKEYTDHLPKKVIRKNASEYHGYCLN